jgi:hypothetical protein
MRRFAILLAAASVAGCTTRSQVASNMPFFAAHTARDRATVTGCISHSWGKTFGFRTRTAEAADRSSVILSTGNVIAVDMVATVFDGGRTEVHERKAAWGWLDDDLRQAVQQCL